MSSPPHRPTLSEESVERALEVMRTGQKLGEHPLRFFLTVLDRLRPPYSLQGDAAVTGGIFDYLSAVITEQLARLRAAYRLYPPDQDDGLALPKDFQQGNTELEAWSLLYYRYVRTDKDLTMQQIAAIVGQDERTARRRHRLGIVRLTRMLVSLEQEHRRLDLLQRLRLALPTAHAPSLIGTETLFVAAWRILTEIAPPRHLVLCGPAGSGKTALALTLAHALVITEQFGDVLWLDIHDLPGDRVDQALEVVSRLELPPVADISPAQTLRAYLSVTPTLIVLDRAERLLSSPELAESVLRLLDMANVILTSRVKGPSSPWLHQITIPELDRNQAYALLEGVLESEMGAERDILDQFDQIWAAVGGNPQALQSLVARLHHLPLAAALSRAGVLDVYLEAWQHLSAAGRRVWLLALVFPCGGMPYEAVRMLAGLDQDAADAALDELVSNALLVPQQDHEQHRYVIPPLVATFLLECGRQNLEIVPGESAAAFLEEALNYRVIQIVQHHDPATAAALLKLASDLGLPGEKCWHYADSFAAQMAESGLWHAWSVQLTRIALDDLSKDQQACWHYMLGVALRWTGQLEMAEDHLLRARADLRSLTLDQVNTLVELSVVCRYRGRVEESYQLAQKALELCFQLGSDIGADRCIHELGQMALNGNDPTQALLWLSRLQTWASRSWGIASQAYLALERFDDALRAAEECLVLLPAQHPNQGRVLATLGQIYHAMGQSEVAVEHLLTAVDLLEWAKDILGYARTCNNLAVAYLSLSPSSLRAAPTSDLFRLLTRALRIQEHVGDQIGAAVTRENLSWLSSGHQESLA